MKFLFLIILSTFILLPGCGDKKNSIDENTIDTSTMYFKMKIDNQWYTYKDNIGGIITSTYPTILAIGGDNKANGESVLLNFYVTTIRYNTDSAAVTPYNKYDLFVFEYVKDNKNLIRLPDAIRQPIGSFNLTEFKLLDTAGKFTGFFRADASYVDSNGKTVRITEGQFNIPRNYAN